MLWAILIPCWVLFLGKTHKTLETVAVGKLGLGDEYGRVTFPFLWWKAIGSGCRLNPTQPTWENFIPRLTTQWMVTLNVLACDGGRRGPRFLLLGVTFINKMFGAQLQIYSSWLLILPKMTLKLCISGLEYSQATYGRPYPLCFFCLAQSVLLWVSLKLTGWKRCPQLLPESIPLMGYWKLIITLKWV